jgi:hypothetical protein
VPHIRLRNSKQRTTSTHLLCDYFFFKGIQTVKKAKKIEIQTKGRSYWEKTTRIIGKPE